MASSHTIKKIARYALTALLLVGMICLTGFLSFTGMLFLNGSIYLAITAFFLGGGIEGEVYAQNINDSLFKMFTDDYWVDVVIEQTLQQLLDNNPSSKFLKDYQFLQNCTDELKDAHDKETLKKTRKSLALKKQYFKDFILSGQADEELEQDFQRVFKSNDKSHIDKQIENKIHLSRLAWILNIGGGISSALVGLEVAQSSITALSAYFGIAISGAALSASIFTIAILGAIGYVFLIHNTITDMIADDRLKTWAGKIRNFLSKPKEESILHYLWRVVPTAIPVGIVVGLGIFATIATAGTWWHAAKAGAKFIPWVSGFASELRTIVVSLMAFTSLTFNIKNSLDSLETFTRLAKISLRDSWKKTTDTINNYWVLEEKNWGRFLNPFRLIILVVTIPFRLATFVGHLFSMGMMADKLDNVAPEISTLCNATNELFEDAHYFLPEEDHHQEHKHGHKHLDLVGWFLKAVLSPVYFLATSWDWIFSKFSKEPLTYEEAAKKMFNGHSKPHIHTHTTFDTSKLLKILRADEDISISVSSYTEEEPDDFVPIKKPLYHPISLSATSTDGEGPVSGHASIPAC